MDSISTGAQGCHDKRIHLQVTLQGLCGADANGPVGHSCRQGVTVRVRHGQDRLDTQFLAGLDDANGNFTPIGYQNP